MKFGHAQKALDFFFHFSPPHFFFFSLLIFFSVAGHLVGFILEGKVFGRAFRILGLDKRKGWWVVELDFQDNFRVDMLHGFCLFLRPP